MIEIEPLFGPGDALRMLAERVRAARKHQGWTQQELAKRSGVGVATVVRIERTGNGQIRTLILLLTALGELRRLEHVLAPRPPQSAALFTEPPHHRRR